MQVAVSGQNISVGNSLQEYAKGRIIGAVEKYFSNAPSGHVRFSKHGREFACDIVINDGTGRHMVIKSNSTSDEVYNAFDLAISKLEKQLRRYKSKLQSHQKRIKLSEITAEVTKYVISTVETEDTGEFDMDNPVIVAEKQTHIVPLSVGDAVMKMDLENLPALMFENIKTGRINVVYYRKDGNISWVDSQ